MRKKKKKGKDKEAQAEEKAQEDEAQEQVTPAPNSYLLSFILFCFLPIFRKHQANRETPANPEAFRRRAQIRFDVFDVIQAILLKHI